MIKLVCITMKPMGFNSSTRVKGTLFLNAGRFVTRKLELSQLGLEEEGDREGSRVAGSVAQAQLAQMPSSSTAKSMKADGLGSCAPVKPQALALAPLSIRTVVEAVRANLMEVKRMQSLNSM